MKREDIKLGMMVTPHSKSYCGNLESSVNWHYAKKKNQPYLFVSRIDTNCIVLDFIKDSNSGDYFLPEDFEPYIEESGNTKMKKSELNSSMLFKMRDGDLCALLDDIENGKMFCNKEDIQQGYSSYCISINDYDEDLSPEDEAYDIVAIKQLNTCVKVIADVLSDTEPEEWDWVEKGEKVDKDVEEPKVENTVQNITINITIDSSNKDSSQFRELINGLSKYATQYSKV